MPEPPAGIITFLFTDIQGSTRLWEQQTVAMRAALAGHDTLLRQAIERHGGSVFKTVGDSFYAAFGAAPAALAAALDAQRALRDYPWGDLGPLRVRMALNTGEAEARDGDYFGPPLNRAARLLPAAHGGQILLSLATQDLVRDALPPGVALQDLGERRLKDLIRPERIFQVVAADLPGDFPPLRSLEAFAHNLPVQLTSFIGREREIAEVKRLLTTTHLLTLTGPGGTGKTRLSLQVGADLLDEFDDGVWLVELAALTDPALVPHAVAAVLGVREEPVRPLIATVTDYLRARRLLLILDNCEHLVAACARTAETLLRSCPAVQILASSREGLGIVGETTWQVPSLSRPDIRRPLPVERLAQYEAVHLFVDRARAAVPSFTITPQNAQAVAQICHRLDGIPLAIELAAARVRALPVAQIAVRLDDRFRLLTSGARTALPRQQTLRALIDWSWDLLTAAEQVLWQRLGVFAGGWTLETAETVCAGDPIDLYEVLDLLASLVNKSLAVMDAQDEAARYRLLETIRAYAREKLHAAGEMAAVRDRHLACFLALAEEAEPYLDGAAQGAWLDRLETEHDNLSAALEWSLERGDAEAAARLAGALGFFWLVRGYWTEGRHWMEAALQRGSALPAARRAKLLRGAGRLATRQGDFARARALLEETLALFRELGDTQGIANALASLGWLAYSQDDYARATVLNEEALALCRELDDQVGIAERLGNLAQAEQARGNYERALALSEESLALFRQLQDTLGVVFALANLGSVAFYQGDYPRSIALHQESLLLCRDLDYKIGIGFSLGSLGLAALYQGDYDHAALFSREALSLYEALGHKRGIAECLAVLAGVAAAAGQAEQAACLAGTAAKLRNMLGLRLIPVDRALQDRTVAAARPALGDSAFAAAWAAGEALSSEQAISLALAGLNEAHPASAMPSA